MSASREALRALIEGTATIDQEAGGAFEIYVIPRVEVLSPFARAVSGDALAASPAASLARLVASVDGSPRRELALSGSCPRSVWKKPFTPVIVPPHTDARTQALTFHVCARGGSTREESRPKVDEALRRTWPGCRPLSSITRPEGGRA